VSNNRAIVKLRFFLGLLLYVSAIASFAQVDRITGKHFATRSEVIASHGMAATAQPLAREIAVNILKQGGSAAPASSYQGWASDFRIEANCSRWSQEIPTYMRPANVHSIPSFLDS
jgi:hypothetical protein